MFFANVNEKWKWQKFEVTMMFWSIASNRVLLLGINIISRGRFWQTCFFDIFIFSQDFQRERRYLYTRDPLLLCICFYYCYYFYLIFLFVCLHLGTVVILCVLPCPMKVPLQLIQLISSLMKIFFFFFLPGFSFTDTDNS